MGLRARTLGHLSKNVLLCQVQLSGRMKCWEVIEVLCESCAPDLIGNDSSELKDWSEAVLVVIMKMMLMMMVIAFVSRCEAAHALSLRCLAVGNKYCRQAS
eukprot:6478085-Amphidinium_carterae.1